VTGRRPNGRALKPNQRERDQRESVIDNLIGRALRGVLSIPEAAVLADYVRAERRVAERTRRSLADTTNALQRHRLAADAEVQRLEAELAAATPDTPPEPLSSPQGAPQPSDGPQPPHARTRPAA